MSISEGDGVMSPELVHKGVAIVQEALAMGLDVNFQDQQPVLGDGRSLLHEAACCGLHDVAKFLLKQGANVNILSHSLQSPLWEACNADQTEMAIFLISKGADLNIRNIGGYTALGRVSTTNSLLIDALQNAGAKI